MVIYGMRKFFGGKECGAWCGRQPPEELLKSLRMVLM